MREREREREKEREREVQFTASVAVYGTVCLLKLWKNNIFVKEIILELELDVLISFCHHFRYIAKV